MLMTLMNDVCGICMVSGYGSLAKIAMTFVMHSVDIPGIDN